MWMCLIEPKMWPLLFMAARPSVDGLDPPMAPNTSQRHGRDTVGPSGRVRGQHGERSRAVSIMTSVNHQRSGLVSPVPFIQSIIRDR